MRRLGRSVIPRQESSLDLPPRAMCDARTARIYPDRDGQKRWQWGEIVGHRGLFRDEVRPLMVDGHSRARAVGASSLRRRED